MTKKEELDARLARHRSRPETTSQKEKREKLEQYDLKEGDFGYHRYIADAIGGGELAARKVQPAISFGTGVLSLDIALGGGLPEGIVEIYGAESVGKTTLLTELIRSSQDQGHLTALVPTELLDIPRAERIGVKVDELVLIREKGERALEMAEMFITDGDDHALFFDSFTGMRPENDQFSAWCSMLVRWFERVAGRMGQRSCIVMTNQVRVKRSLDPRKFFAGSIDSAARRAASYFDTRMELTRSNITEYDFNLDINLVANLMSAPHKIVTLRASKVNGIDVWLDTVRVAVERGVMEKRGSFYYFDGQPVAQGEAEVAKTLSVTTTGTLVFMRTLETLM
jgi:recombination protein RecA